MSAGDPTPKPPRLVPLLTISEAAAQIGISTRTLRGHVSRGDVTYVRFGFGVIKQRILFHPDDLAAFIKRMRHTEAGRIGKRQQMKPLSDSVPPMDFAQLVEEWRAAKRKAKALKRPTHKA